MAKKVTVTRDELVSLAKEMNVVMGLDPTIKTGSKISDDDLKASIIENGTGQIYETDFEEDPEDDEKVIFTEEATATLKKLGIAIEVSDEEPEGDGENDIDNMSRDELIEYIKENDLEVKVTKKMDEDAIREAIVAAQSESSDEETTDDEPEEVVEEKPAKKVKEEKKSSKKEAEKPAKKGKKEEPEEEEEEKPVAKGAKKAPEKTEKAKARDEKNAKMKANVAAKKTVKKADGDTSYSRYIAFADVIKNAKKALNKEEITSLSNDLYVKNRGGNSNEVQQGKITDRGIAILSATGHGILKDGKFKLA